MVEYILVNTVHTGFRVFILSLFVLDGKADLEYMEDVMAVAGLLKLFLVIRNYHSLGYPSTYSINI